MGIDFIPSLEIRELTQGVRILQRLTQDLIKQAEDTRPLRIELSGAEKIRCGCRELN